MRTAVTMRTAEAFSATCLYKPISRAGSAQAQMAFSAHKNAEDVKEFVEDQATLEKKVDELVALIRKAKHMVAFTGAGVSTSAGIPGKVCSLSLP